MTPPEHDLDALLRTPVEPLAPPPGAWLDIKRRSGRLRTTRRAAAVAAAVVAVTAVVLPVALVVGQTPARPVTSAAGTGQARHDAHRGVPGWPTPESTTYSSWRPPATLHGLKPLSVSFVSQTEGYLLGTVAGRPRLARTFDGGDSWSPLPVPAGFDTGSGATTGSAPVGGDSVGGAPVGGVRFATGPVGYLFGSTFWRTTDHGLTWQQLPAPGRITDLEVAGGGSGRMWALVQQCSGSRAAQPASACRFERLYTASVADPRLKPELNVTTLPGRTAQLSLTAQGTGVFVLANRPDGEPVRFWSTDGGRTWRGDTGPCVHRGAIAALIPNEAAILCADPGKRGDRARDLVVLDHLSRMDHHQRVDVAAPPVGVLTGLTANNDGGVVLADGFTGRAGADAPFQVSTDGGRSWQPGGPNLPGGAAFVGFISAVRVVALSAAQGHAFLASNDGGLSWRVTDFGR